MSELSRQGMVKANLAAIACRDSQNGTRTWSLADMVRAGVEAYVAEVYGEGRGICGDTLEWAGNTNVCTLPIGHESEWHEVVGSQGPTRWKPNAAT